LIGFKGVPEKIGEGRRGDGADFRGFRHERRGVAHTVLKLRHVNDDITERLAVATWITGDLQPTRRHHHSNPAHVGDLVVALRVI
jgi:hypothetical protein